MNFKVSVIIPTYGRPDNLKRAIDSVIEQTYKNIEIIVIDDNGINSKKGHETSTLVRHYPHIIYIKLEKNSGGGMARNKGIERASGDYITFLDDDDYYYPEKIQKQLKFMIENSYDISLCDMEIANPLSKKFKHRKKYSEANGFNLKDFLIAGVAFTPMIMVKKEVLLEVNGFLDTPRFQDHTLMLKMLTVTENVGHLAEQLFVHCSDYTARISNSPRFRKGFLIRHALEKKIVIDNKLCLPKLRFNQCAQISPYVKEKFGKYKYICFMLWSLKFSRSCHSVFLTGYRIMRLCLKK
ncbi:glycosyltransferase family 2 protein [Escherichia coli]|nr:glycosyltransferase family 2 protein [Escherichia coli]